MKVSEFKRWLKGQGCQIENLKGHYGVIYGGRKTVMPRHDSKELAQGTMFAILDQLGLKEQWKKRR